MPQSPNDELKRLLNQKGSEKGKQRKYRNEPYVDSDGTRYDSQAEYRYKCKLDMLVKAGAIRGFDYHIPIPLIASTGKIVGNYVADFKIYNNDGSEIWIDVKSPATITALFSFKKKFIKAQYGVDIVIIDSKTLQPAKKP